MGAMSRPRVLLADDDPRVLSVVSRYLDLEGYEMSTVSDGEAAVRIAAADRPDLIILDIMMPGIDGIEACRRIRANAATAQTPVLMFSALSEEAEAARAELMRIGRKQWPRLTENQAYEQAFSDPRNATLVARLYQRPTPTSIYPMPREWLRGEGSQHAKSDRLNSEATAYGELMEKAEEYRNANPEPSIAQAFEKVFTAPANRELAKRERIESASR